MSSCLCLHCSFVLSCVYLTHRALSILIVVLNLQSDNSNIPATSKFGSDVCSVSSNCVFWLLVCLYFIYFLVRCIYQVKRTVINRSLIIWWSSVGGEVFYSSMSRSYSFSETVPLDYRLHMCLFFSPIFGGIGWRVGWYISFSPHGRPVHMELDISLLSGQLGSS